MSSARFLYKNLAEAKMLKYETAQNIYAFLPVEHLNLVDFCNSAKRSIQGRTLVVRKLEFALKRAL